MLCFLWLLMQSGAFFFSFFFRSLCSTCLAADITTPVEEPWSGEDGWWPPLTVWTGTTCTINTNGIRRAVIDSLYRLVIYKFLLHFQHLLPVTALQGQRHERQNTTSPCFVHPQLQDLARGSGRPQHQHQWGQRAVHEREQGLHPPQLEQQQRRRRVSFRWSWFDTFLRVKHLTLFICMICVKMRTGPSLRYFKHYLFHLCD